jgi:hypothetical protein
VVPILEICGTVWAVEHLVEVLIVCGTSAVLALVVVIILFRMARERDERRMALWRERRYPELYARQWVTVKAVAEPVAEACAIPSPPRTVLGPPAKSWLCESCYWVWPSDVPFCGICGGSRASHGAEREVVVREALGSQSGHSSKVVDIHVDNL